MGFPSGTFSHPASGRLQVSFSAEFFSYTGSDWGSGTAALVLRCVVGSGAGQQVAYIRLGGSNTATLERDYTGGTSLPMTADLAENTPSGPTWHGATNIRIACRLYAVP
jgi:hypothetical protein